MPGFISHYKLDKWWIESLSNSQRGELERAFDGLMSIGKGPSYMTGADLDEALGNEAQNTSSEIGLTRGDVAYSELTRVGFLRLLADQITGDLAADVRAHARKLEEEKI